ncbi:Homeodomain protein [Pseudocohnilembus persalinus]|uniref:Homeodomain protein n=1 Tax=Pseudocohnilembus persalinus TaxID=266149 RepID=A0A0V0QKP3_PSEPJ|nr:Homeodomain protein [Pseudocohnilembus persalinus]|eukprot:KRX02772.1 Homeodomain protein [Pseudocohnilembus persalinus]
MRYLIKGGVWKNSEDEILKAAVMKYGLNQWSRISSLLARKSAKQCKQRWYEWLDPQIIKTEWNREEDEKLLHLSRIFPNQWRTIAPIVGRTPTQCVERYDKLLDEAQGKNKFDPNDPRKLKPGEIDPNPESKPARPDPLHMDEDEKEMIAEARVRLANTKGKKAKRLAREKLIEESRRLAQLQKRRELRAAGIEFGRKKVKGIDYNAEVPFERQVPDYVYQTDQKETPKPDVKYQTMTFNQVEGRMRDEQERKFKEIDKKRMKKLMENDMEKIAEKLQKEAEKLFKNKTKLTLPQPQMQDSDLELLGKMNQNQDVSEVSNNATKALVGNYSQREVAQTPIRTPMAPNSILREAQHAIALQQTQTPLLGSVGPDNQVYDNWEHLKGLKPKPSVIPQTPNFLKQNLATGGESVRGDKLSSATPSVFGTTPLRDNFKINNSDAWDDASSVSGSVGINEQKLNKLKQKQHETRIKDEIFKLPQPKNQFQIEIPEFEEEEKIEENKIDQEELEQQRLLELEKEELKKIRLRSLAIQRNLPRPQKIPNTVYEHIYSSENINESRKQAEMLLESEMVNLLAFDSQNFPFQGQKSLNFEVQLENYEENELSKASKLIQKEMENIKNELNHGNINKDFIQQKWEDEQKNLVFSKSEGQIVDLRKASKNDEIKVLQEQATNKRNILQMEQKQLEELEKKNTLLLGGYKKVIYDNLKQIMQQIEDQYNIMITKNVYSELKMQESSSILPRLDEIRQFYAQLEMKQVNLQNKYQELIQEKSDLLEEPGYFD